MNEFTQPELAKALVATPKSGRKTCACDTCRKRRTRCFGGHPCKVCTDLDLECKYTTPQKKRGPQAKVKNAGNDVVFTQFGNDLKNSHELLLKKRFQGLILLVQRSFNSSESSQVRLIQTLNSPLFYVSGESNILRLDPDKRYTSINLRQDKDKESKESTFRGTTCLFFGHTSISCAEAVEKNDLFCRDGYLTFYLQSSLAAPDLSPRTKSFPCSIGLVRLFIHLYFIHIHPQLPMINKKSFLVMDEAKCKDNILLLNSMCALVTQKASIMSTYGVNNASELHGMFFERARSLLEKRFDWPHLNTIQALVLLSILGLGMNNGASAYQYIGIACRQAIELGFNRDIGCIKHCKFSDDGTENSITLTWMCLYIVDRYVSVQLGRPLAISDGDTLIPCVTDTYNQHLMDTLFHMKLCSILGDVTKTLNRSSFKGNTDTGKLYTIYQNLKSMLLSYSSKIFVPKDTFWTLQHHIYLLYHTIYILIHRILPGLVEESCVESALCIRKVIFTLSQISPVTSDEVLSYKEYTFIMPIVVYFGLTSATLLLDVFCSDISNRTAENTRGVDLKIEILKYIWIFEGLEEISMYAVYNREMLFQCLNSVSQITDDEMKRTAVELGVNLRGSESTNYSHLTKYKYTSDKDCSQGIKQDYGSTASFNSEVITQDIFNADQIGTNSAEPNRAPQDYQFNNILDLNSPWNNPLDMDGVGVFLTDK